MELKISKKLILNSDELATIKEARNIIMKISDELKQNNFNYQEKDNFAKIFMDCVNGKIIEDDDVDNEPY